MYQVEKNISFVVDFLITSDELLLIIKNDNEYRLVLDKTGINGIVIKSPNKVLIEYNGYVYYSESGEGKCYKVELATGKSVLISDNKYIGLVRNQENLFLIDTKTESVYSELIDIKSVSTLLKFDGLISSSFFPSDLYCTYFKNDHRLLCFEKGSFQQSWSLDVSETGSWTDRDKKGLKGQIVSIIGIWNGLLIVHVTQNKILAINSAGLIEWEVANFLLPTEQIYFPNTSMINIRSAVNWLLDETHGKMYLLGSRFIFEFDLQTQKRTILIDCSKDRAWFFKEGKLEGNYILFTAYKTGGSPNYIGIFDLTSNSVVWEFQIEKGYFISHPVMHGDKLYIKDDQQILHVFNKV